MSSVPTNFNATPSAAVSNRVSTAPSQRTARAHRSVLQLMHEAEGGLERGFGAIPDFHPVLDAIDMRSGGLLGVVDKDGEEVEIELGVDLAVDMVIQLGDGELGRLLISGKRRFDFYGAGGVCETLRYFPGDDYYAVFSWFQDITKTKLGDSVVIFAADGSVVVDGVVKSTDGKWTEQLKDGSRLVCVDGHLGHQVAGEIGEEFSFDDRRSRWFRKYNPVGNWSFGEILNGESTTSVEILGLAVLYANGTVELWKSHSFEVGAEVDLALVDDGECALYVSREFGSSDIYFFEGGSTEPTGIARYVPEHFLGKDETYYPAWLYAASCSSLPAGAAPTSWLGTFVAILFLVLAILGLAITSAAFVLMTVFCAVAVWSMVRPYVFQVRSFFGV